MMRLLFISAVFYSVLAFVSAADFSIKLTSARDGNLHGSVMIGNTEMQDEDYEYEILYRKDASHEWDSTKRYGSVRRDSFDFKIDYYDEGFDVKMKFYPLNGGDVILSGISRIGHSPKTTTVSSDSRRIMTSRLIFITCWTSSLLWWLN